MLPQKGVACPPRSPPAPLHNPPLPPLCAAPLLVRAARGEAVERAPAWMMRQAGRYMGVYKELTKKHPSFRERSETTDLIVEISLQPWQAFRPDGVILFSDILTPLPAVGIPFDIDETKGPLIDAPIRSKEALTALRPIELDRLTFVGDALKTLHKEVRPHPPAGLAAVVAGSPGCQPPWPCSRCLSCEA